MTMQAMNLPGNVASAPRSTPRFGLFPVRIGAQILHCIGIPMPIEAPVHDARQYAKPSVRVRTKTRPMKPRYEMGIVKQNGNDVEVPVKALVGTPVYLEVQSSANLSDEEREQVKWCCNHPECAGKRWDSIQALVQEHEPDHILRKEAEQAPDGKPHMFMGVLELAGVEGKPEEKNAEGKITKRAVEAVMPTIMILSNEE